MMQTKAADHRLSSYVAGIAAALALLCSGYFAIRYANQPPLDMYAFRQTQTALTAYWFVQDGFRLAYETPVGGVPWAIPFELPVYQALAATLSKLTGMPLDAAGRVVSYAFLLLTLLPARAIIRRLDLRGPVFLVFAALLFSAPIYVYWGRTFMIETAALFFAVAAIRYFIDMLLDGVSWVKCLLFVLFASLAILQKATTGLPVLAVLGVVILVQRVWKERSLRALVFSRDGIAVAASVLLPLLIGMIWVQYTDQIKMLNPFGKQLTADALNRWNWGTLEQRFSGDLWKDVLWERIIKQNLGWLLGVALLVLPFATRSGSRTRIVLLVALALGMLPLLLFTKLHMVHTYYQAANVLFLVFALAVALSDLVRFRGGQIMVVVALLAVMASNYLSLKQHLPRITEAFDKRNRAWAVGGVLRRELASGMQFVAFGNDWSSTFSYIAQRKSFSVPVWFKGRLRAQQFPERYVEPGRLGAVVDCPRKSQPRMPILEWANDRGWKVGEVAGCLLATPEQAPPARDEAAQCPGFIDIARVDGSGADARILLQGWVAVPNSGARFPEQVFLTLTSASGETRIVEALKVPRPDVSKHFGISEAEDAGYSRVLTADLAPGLYVVQVIPVAKGRAWTCDMRKDLVVEVPRSASPP